METITFTPETHREFLMRYQSAFTRWEELGLQLSTKSDKGNVKSKQEADSLLAANITMHEEYRQMLPTSPISRCPISGKILYYGIDIFSLAGLWWDYATPIRPLESPFPTFISLTGAIALNNPIENIPFLCSTGPAVPYVIPRLLEQPGVVAVISSVAIGIHKGYIITYYADQVSPETERVNNWGMNRWTFSDRSGEYMWGEDPIQDQELDFDVGRWIAQKRLFWIAPNDGTFTLQNKLDTCPYIGLSGTQDLQIIQEGEVMVRSRTGETKKRKSATKKRKGE